MYFADAERLSSLRNEYPGLSEVVTRPMRDGVLGRGNHQPCEPQDRTHWLITALTGECASDWVPIHCARGVPPFPSPESELVDILERLELPVTIDLHRDRVGPCETLKELTTTLGEFIYSDDAEGHPLLAAQVHPLTPMHAALMLTTTRDAFTEEGTGFR